MRFVFHAQEKQSHAQLASIILRHETVKTNESEQTTHERTWEK